MEENQIHCPKCNSTQLTATKQGFSGKKAVAGAVLTGGIGLLAGTIGSNKIKITCLACGHVFKPGEGKTALTDNETKAEQKPSKLDELKKDLDERKRIFSSADHMEEALMKILNEGFVRGAVNHYQKTMHVSKEEATEYVEKFIVEHNLSDNVRRKGCFIATACFGDYNAPEVSVLRRYRDETLETTGLGRALTRIYYFISPTIANAISKSDFAKKQIRTLFLNPIVKHLDKNKQA